MIKPRQLKQNSKIGIVSPSYWLNEDDLNKTREELSSLVNPEHMLSVPTDVTDESQVENLFAGSIE